MERTVKNPLEGVTVRHYMADGSVLKFEELADYAAKNITADTFPPEIKSLIIDIMEGRRKRQEDK